MATTTHLDMGFPLVRSDAAIRRLELQVPAGQKLADIAKVVLVNISIEMLDRGDWEMAQKTADNLAIAMKVLSGREWVIPDDLGYILRLVQGVVKTDRAVSVIFTDPLAPDRHFRLEYDGQPGRHRATAALGEDDVADVSRQPTGVVIDFPGPERTTTDGGRAG